jgi:putative nucleotidyltransferase with HDIG domain
MLGNEGIMNNMRAHNLVQGVSTLVSLPEVCMQVNDLVDDPNSSAAAIGKVISQDPGLTTRLLKIANSSFYHFPSKIETVSRAVTIIGTRELRFLVLATSSVRSFDNLPNDLVDMSAFWRHSVYTGVIARILAGHCNVLHKERLFVAGLLHDVGHLVMYNKIPELVRVMFHRVKVTGEPLYEAEREVFDTDHGEVGEALLKLWRLPQSLQEVVRHHHEPEKAEQFRLETAIVHMANSLAMLAEMGTTSLAEGPPVSDLAWQLTGVSPDQVESLLHDAREQFLEALLLFLPGVISVRQ